MNDVDYAKHAAADDELVAEICVDCGGPVPIGGWPFCASDANPDGHAKGVNYRWRMRVGMKTQGWTRRLR